MDVRDGANVLRKLTDPGLGSVDALEEVLLAQRLGARLLEAIRLLGSLSVVSEVLLRCVSMRQRSVCMRYRLRRRGCRILRGLRVVGVGLRQLVRSARLLIILQRRVSGGRVGAHSLCLRLRHMGSTTRSRCCHMGCLCHHSLPRPARTGFRRTAGSYCRTCLSRVLWCFKGCLGWPRLGCQRDAEATEGCAIGRSKDIVSRERG